MSVEIAAITRHCLSCRVIYAIDGSDLRVFGPLPRPVYDGDCPTCGQRLHEQGLVYINGLPARIPWRLVPDPWQA